MWTPTLGRLCDIGWVEIMKFDTLKDKKEPKTGFVCSDRNIVNPFDYTEKYEKDTKK